MWLLGLRSTCTVTLRWVTCKRDAPRSDGDASGVSATDTPMLKSARELMSKQRGRVLVAEVGDVTGAVAGYASVVRRSGRVAWLPGKDLLVRLTLVISIRDALCPCNMQVIAICLDLVGCCRILIEILGMTKSCPGQVDLVGFSEMFTNIPDTCRLMPRVEL
ncbi:hypothetical protein TIFTF001_029906 [Ficus carica]|uniref:Uncharacterized protein n=1 Tax=Ficus carica TaxID=3494 RepID=A0AA88DSM4_FICCA|nr:hypothetical protein TIFTF001_029906 [Ficus carica]